jgi:hypothetical protein
MRRLTADQELTGPDLENPYALTSETYSEAIANSETAISGVSILKSSLVWSIVCSVSAAPSFFIAVTEVAENQAIAMVIGVFIFIMIYTFADLVTRNLAARKNTRIRTILRATFIVRTIMVVFFPIALFTDVLLGAISVSILSSAARIFNAEFAESKMTFGMALATTLLQGCMLSILLFFLGLLIAVVVFVIRSLKRLIGRNLA